MKRKTSATVIMYTVLVFFFVIWDFPDLHGNHQVPAGRRLEQLPVRD